MSLLLHPWLHSITTNVSAVMMVVIICLCITDISMGVTPTKLRYGDRNVRIPRLENARFEYTYSFKGPHLQNSSHGVDFWEYGGNAIVIDSLVRLTTSIRHRRGYLWSSLPVSMSDWIVFMEVRLMGRGRMGGNGMAFWYTKNRMNDGPIFGSSDNWDGLGIMFDTITDSSSRVHSHISGVLNDGSINYEKASVSTSQSIEFGGCNRSIRNTARSLLIKISYVANTLELSLDIQGNGNFGVCISKSNIALPVGYFFGVSADTGALADDHDIYKFLTYNMSPIRASEEDQLMRLEEKRAERLANDTDDFGNQIEDIEARLRKAHPFEFDDWDDVDMPEEDFKSDNIGVTIDKSIMDVLREEILDAIQSQELRLHETVDVVNELKDIMDKFGDDAENINSDEKHSVLRPLKEVLHVAVETLTQVESMSTILSNHAGVPASVHSSSSNINNVQLKLETIERVIDKHTEDTSNTFSVLERTLKDEMKLLSTSVIDLRRTQQDFLRIIENIEKKQINSINDLTEKDNGMGWGFIILILSAQLVFTGVSALYVKRVIEKPKKFI